jgi:hypothetical protein
MAPIPLALLPLVLFLEVPAFNTPLRPFNAYSLSTMPRDTGTLNFCRTQVVDAGVGFDQADPFADTTADLGVYISNDGMRQAGALLNIGQKRRRMRPEQLDDRLADWVPVDDADLVMDAETLEQLDKVSGGEKRKRYESSVSHFSSGCGARSANKQIGRPHGAMER